MTEMSDLCYLRKPRVFQTTEILFKSFCSGQGVLVLIITYEVVVFNPDLYIKWM